MDLDRETALPEDAAGEDAASSVPLAPLEDDGPRWYRPVAIGLLLGAVVLAAGSMVHLPSYSIGPGAARDVGALLSIDGGDTYRSQGEFILTTVSVSDSTVSLFQGLAVWLDPAVSLIDRSAIVQPGLDDERQAHVNRHDMEASKQAAQVAAFSTLGFPVRALPGARVLTIIPGSGSDGLVRPGDRIVEVDRVAVATPDAAIERIRARRIGEKARLTLERGGTAIAVEVRTTESITDAGKASVGATIAPAFDLPFDVEFDTANIGGPSGGLVFALALMEALEPEDLSRGHRIAATGTIGIDGGVGEVGGVDEKVVAAERSGADVFVVPASEVAEARAAARKARVIGVRTLAEALAALRALPEAVRKPAA